MNPTTDRMSLVAGQKPYTANLDYFPLGRNVLIELFKWLYFWYLLKCLFGLVKYSGEDNIYFIIYWIELFENLC